MQLLFQEKGIRAEINIFLACDQAFDDSANLGMHQRLAAGDGNHGGSAFVDGAETLFRSQVFLEDVGGVLDLATSGASEITAEQGLEHEHERVLLASGELLAQDVGGYSPHL